MEPDYSYLLSLALTNDTTEFSFDKDLSVSLKRFLIEMKMQVDRWDLVTETFVFHTDMKPIVLEFLKNQINYESNQHMNSPNIWGATLRFTDSIPKDNVFAVSLTATGVGAEDNRNVSLGILPSGNVKKYYGLKAFW